LPSPPADVLDARSPSRNDRDPDPSSEH
jgi:hypothetical protein